MMQINVMYRKVDTVTVKDFTNEVNKMSSMKIITVIAGILDDRFFSHACYVAENLAKMLPNFYFKRIWKNSSEWKSWLHETCKKHGWFHTESPLIWREIGVTGNKVKYIGGVQQFWKLLHEYYNINHVIKDEDLEALKLDALIAYKKELKSVPSEVHIQRRVITIIGAGTSMCFELISQLITIKELWLSHGIFINLYDVPNHYFKLQKVLRDVETIESGLQTVSIIDNIFAGLYNCDILIYLDHLAREKNEGTESWLKRNYDCIKILAKKIDNYAPQQMKVIFCSMGPICFCANTLQTMTAKLLKTNIVAVSAHYGLDIVYPFIRSSGFDVKDFGCPPVWGFVGINQFVDVGHMIQKHVTQRPMNWELSHNNKKGPLHLSIGYSELRWFFYMSHDKNPHKNDSHRTAITHSSTENLQKCKAICDLLKLWHNDGNDIDDIISLGIFSDGTFGIPEGICFSQPVCLKIRNNESREWVPFADFPLPCIPQSIFHNLILTAVNIIDGFVNPRITDRYYKSRKPDSLGEFENEANA